MINILHVIDSLDVGGAEKVVYFLTTGLDRARYNVIVCSMESERTNFMSERLKTLEYKVYFLNRHRGFDIGLARRIRKIIGRENIDIVHCHIGGELYGHLAAIATDASVLTTIHGEFNYGLKMRFVLSFLNTAKKNYKIAVSRELQSRHRLDDLIYNGIDIHAMKTERTPTDLRIDMASNEVVVGIIGRLNEIKNHKNFLDASALICRQLDNVRFLIVGSGPLQQSLEQYAANLGIASKTTFTGHRDDVENVLQLIDISVLSSDAEGLPVVALESMAAGKPLVSTRVGGMPELIEENETGLLVPPRDPESLSNAIARLITDGGLRERIGRAARARVAERFSLRGMIEQYETLYRNLLHGAR
ncbi:MAG: glycosyltransferase [Candidatus Krumholzibacteria bacterium]|nr:glycosyltransferase [Candidatus Krumholzibacteria bacterium]